MTMKGPRKRYSKCQNVYSNHVNLYSKHQNMSQIRESRLNSVGKKQSGHKEHVASIIIIINIFI